jgi:hypothetical protein
MNVPTICKYTKEKSNKKQEAANVNKPGIQLSMPLHRKNLIKMTPSMKKEPLYITDTSDMLYLFQCHN